jgi:cell fate regulator YaaT (PSP1 superfamily)
LRIATKDDYEKIEQNFKKEADALKICEKKIVKHKLKMNLVNVDYSFDGKKVVFFFTADGRVDFRELVKELASTFRTRIELRQIGVRDETKMKGGIGPCGREVCCASFMAGFHPVSIKMAKEQNISLNPTKISGLCGRLMCCLAHEYEVYREIKPKLKRVGSTVMTPDGPGFVVDNLILLEKCKVRVALPGETMEIRQYPLSTVKTISKEEADKQFVIVKNKKPKDNLYKNPSETWDDDELPANNKPQGNRNNNRNRRKKKKPAQNQQKNTDNSTNKNNNRNANTNPDKNNNRNSNGNTNKNNNRNSNGNTNKNNNRNANSITNKNNRNTNSSTNKNNNMNANSNTDKNNNRNSNSNTDKNNNRNANSNNNKITNRNPNNNKNDNRNSNKNINSNTNKINNRISNNKNKTSNNNDK